MNYIYRHLQKKYYCLTEVERVVSLLGMVVEVTRYQDLEVGEDSNQVVEVARINLIQEVEAEVAKINLIREVEVEEVVNLNLN